MPGVVVEPRFEESIFEQAGGDAHEQVVFCQDLHSGLRAIIAVHSTLLGPALGGARFHAYARECDALEDALRLARAMTYKAAAAGLDLGGGKAVILGDPTAAKTEPLLRAFGRHVDALGGRYITAEDVGTTQADMDLLRRETPFVTGVSPELGGSGDPSPATAHGLVCAMRAVAGRLWGSVSLAGRHIVVAGVGKVGSDLVGRLVAESAEVTVADVDPGAVAGMVERHGVATVPSEKAHATACDIFSPCAMGGVLNAAIIGELSCSAVVGAANNQLADDRCAPALERTGVLYAPDFIVNAGGLINIAEELSPGGWQQSRAAKAVERISHTVTAVFDLAQAEGITTAVAADRMAERRMADLAGLCHIRRVDSRVGANG